MSTHRWEKLPTGRRSTSTLPWPFCARCGAVRLRSGWAVLCEAE